MISRRRFGAALAAVLAAGTCGAQTAGKVARVAYLTPGGAPSEYTHSFVEAMRALGYVEGSFRRPYQPDLARLLIVSVRVVHVTDCTCRCRTGLRKILFADNRAIGSLRLHAGETCVDMREHALERYLLRN